MVEKLDFDIKSEYFRRLVDMVINKKHPKIDYIPLLDLLNSMKFEIIDKKDEDRVSDGEYLRHKFCDEEGIYEHLYEFDGTDVSVLEVLIGLAERLSFQTWDFSTGKHDIPDCFWEILRNLDIEKYSAGNYKPLNIKEKVRIWMFRRFKKNGSGSPFPLQNAKNDQRFVDLWGQLNAYVMEKR